MSTCQLQKMTVGPVERADRMFPKTGALTSRNVICSQAELSPTHHSSDLFKTRSHVESAVQPVLLCAHSASTSLRAAVLQRSDETCPGHTGGTGHLHFALRPDQGQTDDSAYQQFHVSAVQPARGVQGERFRRRAARRGSEPESRSEAEFTSRSLDQQG